MIEAKINNPTSATELPYPPEIIFLIKRLAFPGLFANAVSVSYM